jgi:hypothetical protein
MRQTRSKHAQLRFDDLAGTTAEQAKTGANTPGFGAFD